MSKTTQPIFIVGTGRSGTRALYKMLLGTPGVEVHHEYLCTHVQQTAALFSMGEISRVVARHRLAQLYWSAVQLSDSAVWIDASNKASWVMALLRDLFPSAKFVVLYRDGRKVVPSFLHKLGAECYDDKSVAAVLEWLDGTTSMAPPPEKRYWWKIPREGETFAAEFRSYDQLQRICYHWTSCNAEIRRQLQSLPRESYFETKLEDLVSAPGAVKSLASFIGIEPKPEHFEALQTPENALFPMDFHLTDEQMVKFNAICGFMMAELGYTDAETYDVHY